MADLQQMPPSESPRRAFTARDYDAIRSAIRDLCIKYQPSVIFTAVAVELTIVAAQQRTSANYDELISLCADIYDAVNNPGMDILFNSGH